MLLGRRSFLTGLGAVALAAPAIVHAGNLMPVSTRHIIAPAHTEKTIWIRYSGYEALNIKPEDIFSAANYGIRQSAVECIVYAS